MCQQPDQSFIFQQALIAKHIFCLHAHLQSCTWSRDKCFGSDLQDSRYLVQAFLTMSWMRMITIFDILVVIRVRPGRPLALSEPEPTRPFGIPLPEPTYLQFANIELFDPPLIIKGGWNSYFHSLSRLNLVNKKGLTTVLVWQLYSLNRVLGVPSNLWIDLLEIAFLTSNLLCKNST